MWAVSAWRAGDCESRQSPRSEPDQRQLRSATFSRTSKSCELATIDTSSPANTKSPKGNRYVTSHRNALDAVRIARSKHEHVLHAPPFKSLKLHQNRHHPSLVRCLVEHGNLDLGRSRGSPSGCLKSADTYPVFTELPRFKTWRRKRYPSFAFKPLGPHRASYGHQMRCVDIAPAPQGCTAKPVNMIWANRPLAVYAN